MEDFEGAKASVNIYDFKVGDESTDYTVTYAGSSGLEGFPPSGTKFSTFDRDNDSDPVRNCAR